jgi:hypothetical protein
VICALRGRHHADAGHLDDARVIGADRLLLDHRHALHLVVLADARRALRPQFALRRPVADFGQRAGHPLAITELGQAGLHQHAQRCTGLDGVHPPGRCR